MVKMQKCLIVPEGSLMQRTEERIRISKARFKRRTFHVPNLMQMKKIDCFRSFALDLIHEKFDV